MGGGVSVTENIDFNELKVNDALLEFLEEEKCKSHAADDININDCRLEVSRLRQMLKNQIFKHRLSKYNMEYILHETIDNRSIDDLILFLNDEEFRTQKIDINSYKHRYNQADFCKVTAIFHACTQGLLEYVKVLCKFGANTSLGREFDRAPALFGASCNGHLDVVKELVLNYNVNIDQQNTENISPIMAAIGNNHYEIVKFLRDQGASLNQIGSHGETCIFIASYSNSLESLEAILEPEIISETLNKLLSEVVLGSVIDKNDNELQQFNVEYNFIKNKINMVDHKNTKETETKQNIAGSNNIVIEGNRPNQEMGIALWHSDTEASFYQLDSQINKLLNDRSNNSLALSGLINMKTNFGWSAMHIAAYKGNLEVLKLLIENGGNINDISANDGSYTPLYLAVENHQEKMFEYLRSIDAYKYNNIFDAAKNGDSKEIGKFVRDKFADINQIDKTDPNNNTPLTYACRYGHLACVQYILCKGGKKTFLLSNRRSAIFEAISNNHTAIAKYLWRNGCDINSFDKDNIRPIILAAKQNHFRGVNLCVNCSARLEVFDNKGRTAFFYCCMNGNEKIFDILHRTKKIDIERPDNEGVTPLMIACAKGHLNIIRSLVIDLNCYLNCISSAGYMAIDYSRQKMPNQRDAIMEIFELRKNKKRRVGLWKQIYLSMLKVLELESITHRKILTRRKWRKPAKLKKKHV
jgi:ankyrin repeat protein